jgi:hypothetical protein
VLLGDIRPVDNENQYLRQDEIIIGRGTRSTLGGDLKMLVSA